MERWVKKKRIMDKYLIINVVNGFMGTYILYTACELRIFDYLDDAPKNAQKLADNLNVEKNTLLKILRPLVAYGFISINEKQGYCLENIGEMLVSTREDSLWTYVLFCGRESIKVWGKIYPAIKRNCTPRMLVGESDIFVSQKKDKEKFEIFDGMMESVNKSINLDPFFDVYRNKYQKLQIVDVGGGTGSILFKFLDYYINSNGIIIDLEHVANKANKNIRRMGLEGRCVFEVSDFFQELKIKGDVFILSRILHDWNDNRAFSILKSVSNCMTERSELLIIEELLPEISKRGALEAYVNDLQMWAFCDGKERTEIEFCSLLDAAGLKLRKTYCTQQGSFLYVLVVCKKESVSGENCIEEGTI
jgi:hypothetical protein